MGAGSVQIFSRPSADFLQLWANTVPSSFFFFFENAYHATGLFHGCPNTTPPLFPSTQFFQNGHTHTCLLTHDCHVTHTRLSPCFGCFLFFSGVHARFSGGMVADMNAFVLDCGGLVWNVWFVLWSVFGLYNLFVNPSNIETPCSSCT
jgi:hypothetical protein